RGRHQGAARRRRPRRRPNEPFRARGGVPGLSLIHSLCGHAAPDDQHWERAIRATRCDRASETTSIVRDDGFSMGVSTYPGYPCSVHEDENSVVALEGRAYGIPQAAAIARVVAAVSADAAEADLLESLQSCVRDWDGDFVVVAWSKQRRRLALVTDCGG